MLNYITLALADLTQAAQFYQQAMPCMQTQYIKGNATQPELLLLKNSQTTLAFISPDAFLALTGYAYTGHPLLSIECDSQQQVDAQYHGLLEAGCQSQRPPQPLSWGGYAAFVHDVFGICWELHFKQKKSET